MGKCPPGVICIENMTVVFMIIIVTIIGYIAYNISHKNDLTNKYVLNVSNVDNKQENSREYSGLYPRPAYSFSNVENDVLLNPYQAPLRDNRIFPNANSLPNRIPINIATQSYNSSYRQIGILTRIGDKETILPLLGRPRIANRDKWNFYTMSESNNLLKLPITHKGKKCMSENGCDDLYTGDTVNVDGYNDSFKVTTYENESPQYIPYI
jgi:hypothetical protein